MKFKLAKENDEKKKVSYCVWPFIHERNVYWFHKVVRTYKLKRFPYYGSPPMHPLHPVSWYLQWELINIEV